MMIDESKIGNCEGCARHTDEVIGDATGELSTCRGGVGHDPITLTQDSRDAISGKCIFWLDASEEI